MQTPDAVLDNCHKLMDFGAWSRVSINPAGWLDNFQGTYDQKYAAYLLSRFMFFSDALTNQLFVSAFADLSTKLQPRPSRFALQAAEWRRFLNSVIITIIQGEQPNPSDSGWLFARKARQILGIDQDALKEPRDALQAVHDGFSGPIVFIDDFSGTGEQFLASWRRLHTLAGGSRTSFSALSAGACSPFYFCTAMIAEKALERLETECPLVKCSFGNLVPKRYSLVAEDSLLWPSDVQGGPEFIKRVSQDLGYGDRDGGENDWRGFHELGLGLAFEHSVPDSTLPIFYHQGQGWKPLVRRV